MVSGISFRANSTTSARDLINKPQAQTRTTQDAVVNQPVKPKKKHTALKVIGGLVAAAAVIAGSLVAGHKLGGFQKIIDMAGKDGAGKMTKWAGTAAGYLNQGGEFITKHATTAWNAVKGFFSKAETPAA